MSTLLERSIGAGPLFPIELKNGSWDPVVGDVKLIENSIISILVYQIGMKIRQEIFGNRNYQCLEEPNVNATRLLIYRFTKNAITAWEPRVELLDNQVSFTATQVKLKLKYRVLTSRLVNELDFSYQKQE